jgi:hypothetical protein
MANASPDLPLIGYLPADLMVQEADRVGAAVYDYVPSLQQAAGEIASKLQEEIGDAVE